MSKLTVAQRIVLHLSLHSRYRDEFECPEAVTQKGISNVLDLSRSHVALELKKLIAEGEVEVRLAHVRRARSRRKVYFLSIAAERKAASMRGRAQEVKGRWIDPDGRPCEGQGSQLLRAARRLAMPLTPIYESLLHGGVADLRQAPTEATPFPSVEIVGRTRELEELRSWLKDGPPILLLTGMAGIGKTTVARALFQEAKEGVWIRVYPFHSPSSLLTSIAHGLSSSGRSRLLSYTRSNPPDYVEAALLLTREGAGLQLFFDDVGASPSAAQVLRLLLESPPPGCKVLMTARRRPDFLKAADFLGGTVGEMPMEGLPLEETRELLQQLGVGSARVEEVHEMTGGHPLLLKMAASADTFPRTADVAAFFLDEVLADLDNAEEEALIRASVFRRPVPLDALGGIASRTLRSLVTAGVLTHNDGLYEVHDIIAPLVREHEGEGIREAHERAARFCATVADWLEAIHHYQAAGQVGRALHLADERLDVILEAGQAEEVLKFVRDARRTRNSALIHLEARALDYLGRWARALVVLEEGIPGAEAGRRTPMLLLRGRILSKRGEAEEAEQTFQEAAALARKEGDDLDLGRALYGLGIVKRKLGRLDEALGLMQEALEFFRGDDAQAERGRAHMEMGVIELQGERPEEAVRWFLDSASLLAPSRVDSAYLHNNLGIAYSRLARPEEALEAFEVSIKLAEEAGMVRAEAYALSNASDLYAERGQVDTALGYCDRSLQIFRRLQDPVMVSACYANQAKAERSRGNLAAAEALYSDSLRALEGTRAPYSLAARWLEFSDLYEELGEDHKSQELRSKALAVMKESGPRYPRS